MATLGLVLSLIGYAGHGVYRIATDEFVAPCVLSPDSDLVIQSKLSMAALVAERFRAVTRREEIDVSVEAADKAVGELEELKEETARGMDFTAALTAKQAVAKHRGFAGAREATLGSRDDGRGARDVRSPSEEGLGRGARREGRLLTREPDLVADEDRDDRK